MQSLLEYPEVVSGVSKGPDLTRFYGGHSCYGQAHHGLQSPLSMVHVCLNLHYCAVHGLCHTVLLQMMS